MKEATGVGLRLLESQVHQMGGKSSFPQECSLLLTFLKVTAIAMELPGGEGMRKMAKEGRKEKQNWGISMFSGILEVLAFVP